MERHSNKHVVAGQLRGYSQTRINSFTKNELQEVLGAFGRRYEMRVSKSQLVAAVLQLKQDIIDETVSWEEIEEGVQSEENLLSEAKAAVQNSLLQAFILAWVMKPLVPTMGMREGSRNEVEVIKALPAFFKNQKGAFVKATRFSGYSFQSDIGLSILHIRSTGFLESTSCKLLADSPDGIAAAINGDTVVEVFAVKIKTVTAPRTVQAATRKKEQYGTYIVLSDVGVDRQSTELFRILVPTTPYRAQALHHAAALSINSVMFVVPTGGSMTEGRVIYSCMARFPESIRHQYIYLLDCVRHTAFGWIGGEPMYIPTEYDDMLRQSYASDIHSFMS